MSSSIQHLRFSRGCMRRPCTCEDCHAVTGARMLVVVSPQIM